MSPNPLFGTQFFNLLFQYVAVLNFDAFIENVWTINMRSMAKSRDTLKTL